MNQKLMDKRDILAQWSFDTRPILGRFHIWLDDIEIDWMRGEAVREFTRELAFLDGRMERLFAMTGAVTALGTQVFGRPGAGAALDKAHLNQVKKDADAISAYAMSESLWYLSRQLPENHAIMVCLGEGLMPKAGETPEMGSNPQIGFGRVYARPEVARWLDQKIVRLLNDRDYGWDGFYGEIKKSGITVWGAAIDTLENTTRFAKGCPTGPMTVLHLFDQPLLVARPYEGYVGMVVIPKEVVQAAAERAVLINYRTPRALVVDAIERTYPGIRREHIHVWTLGGESRASRISSLWKSWQAQGVHIVEDGWVLPSGMGAFTEAGTYAPTFRVGTWKDESGHQHLFMMDGYAASAEAAQSATLGPMLGLDVSMVPFTSKFDLAYDKEQDVMRLDPAAPDFGPRLEALAGGTLDGDAIENYRRMIREADSAGFRPDRLTITADDFFPEKRWDTLAVSGYMGPDPYSGAPGVQEVAPGIFRVAVRLASTLGDKRITFTLRLGESLEQSRLVFSPLLNRFLGGEPFATRPVRISDSGRIRNELQTLCADALEFVDSSTIRIHFDRIPPEVIPYEKQKTLLDVLRWYKSRHPLWFSWMEIEETSAERLTSL
jgi:hypothetical protein